MSDPNDKQELKNLPLKDPDPAGLHREHVLEHEHDGGEGGGEGTSEAAVDVGGSTDNAGVDAGVLPAQGFTPDGRTWQDVPSPGSLENAVRLTNEFTTQFGIGHPTNTGECPLGINGLDENGRLVPGFEGHLVLQPGESVPWYHAAPGSVTIAVAAFNDCPGHAQLTYDTPVG